MHLKLLYGLEGKNFYYTQYSCVICLFTSISPISSLDRNKWNNLDERESEIIIINSE